MTDSAESEFLGALLTEFLDRLRGGEGPSIAEYCRRYPQQAEQIQEVLEAAALVQGLREDLAAQSDGLGFGQVPSDLLGNKTPSE